MSSNLVRLVASLLAITSLAACSTAATAPVLISDEPLPTYSKSPGPTSYRTQYPIPDCVDWTWTVDDLRGPQALASLSETVVVGLLSRYAPGHWNTPDAEHPTREQFDESGYHVTIVRDVELAVEKLLRGSEADAADAYIQGGTAGCDTVAYDNMPDLEAGSRRVFFMTRLPVGGSADLRPQLFRTWAVDEHDVVTTDVGGFMTLDDLAALLDAMPYVPDLSPDPSQGR